MDVSVSLPPELIGMIKDRVDSGRYSSVSDVVREALRLLERTDLQMVEDRTGLQQAWRDGVESGDAGLLDFTELKAVAHSRLAKAIKG